MRVVIRINYCFSYRIRSDRDIRQLLFRCRCQLPFFCFTVQGQVCTKHKLCLPQCHSARRCDVELHIRRRRRPRIVADRLRQFQIAHLAGVGHFYRDGIILNRANRIIAVGHVEVVQTIDILRYDIACTVGQVGNGLGLTALERHGAHAFAVELNAAEVASDRLVVRIGQRNDDGIVLGGVRADRADDLLHDRQANLLLGVFKGNQAAAGQRVVIVGESDVRRFFRDRRFLLTGIGGQVFIMEHPLLFLRVIGHKAFLAAGQLIVGDGGVELGIITAGVTRLDDNLHQIACGIQNIARLVLTAILIDPVIEGTKLLKHQGHELDQAFVVAFDLVESNAWIVLPTIAGSGIVFIKLLHHESELRLGGIAVHGLKAIEGNIRGDQVATMIRPHMGLRVGTRMDLVADHGAIELTGLPKANLNLRIWGNDMAGGTAIDHHHRGIRSVIDQ